jgi:hypothetical protein
MLAVFTPEIVTVYGSGKPVDIIAAFVQSPGSVKTDPTGTEINLNAALTFKVGDSVAASFTLSGVDFKAFLNAVPGMLHGSISKSSIGTVSNFQTTLGMTAAQFQAEVQGNMDKYISEANAKLTAGLPLTKVGPVDVSNVEFNFNNGYVEAGITALPGFFEGVQDLWGMYKKEVDRIRAGHYYVKKYTVEEVTTFLM